MTFVITADRLFDGTGSPSRLQPVVEVVADKIGAVHTGFDPSIAGAPRVDFPDCTILPGLIDSHVHLVFSALDTNEAIVEQVTQATDQELLTLGLANARAALRSGLTTIRDCGGRGRIVQGLRDRIRRGEADGPDVLACGAPITTKAGHCHWLGLVAETPAEVFRAAEKMIAEDADFLKVMATGGNMTPSSDPLRAQYDAATLCQLAETGRRGGRYTAAHVLSRSALPGVVAARMRTIEHCDWRIEEDRYEFDADLARRMIDQDQHVGLTMSGITRRAFLPQVGLSSSGPVRRLNARFSCERRLIDAGVRFNLHSDAGVRWTPIDRFDLGLRAAAIELHLTAAEVLRAATASAAAAIGLNDRGLVQPGRRADLLIVAGNPLEDLANLARVRAVMKAGRWVDLT